MARRPHENDISIGEGAWITDGKLVEDLSSAIEVDPFLADVFPFIDSLETACVAECCGIDAFFLWPEEIKRAAAKYTREELVDLSSRFSACESEIGDLPSDTVLSTRMNQGFRKSVFPEVLNHIRMFWMVCSKRPPNSNEPETDIHSTPESDEPVPPKTLAAGTRIGRLGVRALMCVLGVATLVVAGIVILRPGAKPAPPEETVRVWVAARDIPVGTDVTAENLETLFQQKDVAPDLIPHGAIGEPKQLIGSETVRTLNAGNPVAASDLRAISRFELPENYKQFTVRAEIPKEFEGRVLPRRKVDVLLIPHGKMPDGPAERVLSGVFVLPMSIVHTLDENTGEMIVSPSTVSLGVTDEQIKRLIEAEERGTFWVVPAK